MNPAREGDDMAALARAWQGHVPAGPSPKVDVEALARTLYRRQRLARLMMGLDVLGAVLMVAVAVWMVASAPTARFVVWVVCLTVLALGTVAVALWIRRPVLSAPIEQMAGEGGVEAMIGASERQLRASLGIIRLLYAVVAVCFVFLAGWAWVDLRPGGEFSAATFAEDWPVYAFAVAYGLAFLVGGAWLARRRRAELERWAQVRAALGR